LTRPYLLRRLKTDKNVIRDLPDKTEMTAFCGLTKKQAALYQETVEELTQSLKDADGMKRRGLVLASLIRLKQICNHPSQWLRDGDYVSEASGKFGRLSALCEEIAARQEKVLVFTQFRELADRWRRFSSRSSARPASFCTARPRCASGQRWSRAPDRRGALLRAFAQGGRHGPQSHRRLARRPLRPLVEPCRRRAGHRSPFRIGQKRNVLVHKFVCRARWRRRSTPCWRRNGPWRASCSKAAPRRI